MEILQTVLACSTSSVKLLVLTVWLKQCTHAWVHHQSDIHTRTSERFLCSSKTVPRDLLTGSSGAVTGSSSAIFLKWSLSRTLILVGLFVYRQSALLDPRQVWRSNDTANSLFTACCHDADSPNRKSRAWTWTLTDLGLITVLTVRLTTSSLCVPAVWCGSCTVVVRSCC